MTHNILNRKHNRAFTLVELIVTITILSFIALYIWKVYFSSSETMRHTVAQSQIQSDIRNFLDQIEIEMMTCYSFYSVDTENKSFSFYCFPFGRPSLEDIYYDPSTGEPLDVTEESDQNIKVKKIEYSWKEGVITKKRTPGKLYFLKKPMVFEESSSGFDDSDLAMTKEVLKDIDEFEVKGYQQINKPSGDELVTYVPVKPETATSTTFIVLRIHAFKDEAGKKRDEELDIVTKFYSNIRLRDAAYPGYFCSTDDEGRF